MSLKHASYRAKVSSLINGLNDLLDHYRMLINTRATVNKRRAAGAEDVKVEDNNPIEPEENEDPIEGGN